MIMQPFAGSCAGSSRRTARIGKFVPKPPTAPKMNGLQAAREIARLKPQTPMLLLTVQQVSSQLRDEARKAGFRGAVSKDTGSEVLKGLEALLRDETYFAVDGPNVAA